MLTNRDCSTGLDEGEAVGIAGAVLAVLLAVLGWWAAREPSGGNGPSGGGRRVVQKAQAGRDVNMAGRDQTIINRRRNE